MNLRLGSLISLLTAVGCVSVRDFQAVRGADGLYRPQLKKEDGQTIAPELVLRTKDGHVVTTAEEADQVLASTPSVDQLNADTKAGACSVKAVYPAKAAQFRAERELAAAHYELALEALDEAERLCPGVNVISSQEYLRAVALAGLGQTRAAREAAERFLTYASAVRPAIYAQSNGPRLDDVRRAWAQDNELLSVYRHRAKAFLQNGTPLAWNEPADVPKFYANNPFRPGGNRFAGGLVLPAFVTFDDNGLIAAAIGYYSWGLTAVQGMYGYSSTTGNWLSGRVRRSVFESPDRHLNVEVYAGARTTKLLRITKTEDWLGPHEDTEVVRSSVDPSLGVGATYRVRPDLGVSGQIGGIANRLRNRIDVPHSLYAFYDLFDAFSVNAGYIESKPMVALGIMYLLVGYDFRGKNLALVFQGMTF